MYVSCLQLIVCGSVVRTESDQFDLTPDCGKLDVCVATNEQWLEGTWFICWFAPSLSHSDSLSCSLSFSLSLSLFPLSLFFLSLSLSLSLSFFLSLSLFSLSLSLSLGAPSTPTAVHLP